MAFAAKLLAKQRGRSTPEIERDETP
jgi:hypothetical protein